MPDHIIGNENLPNVYIDKITLENDKIKVDLSIFDLKDGLTWKNNTAMERMDTFVLLTSDQEIANSIINGTSPTDYETYDYSYIKKQCNTDYSSSSDYVSAIYEKYICEVEFENPDYSGNLYVFCCNYFQINYFDNIILNKFHGPTSGEIIMTSGSLTTQSGYFYYPSTNQEYGGPTHVRTNGEVMEGSRHLDTPHEIVVWVPENNSKINDDRS